MWALVNKADLKVIQVFMTDLNYFDSEISTQIEFTEPLDCRYLKAREINGIITIEEDVVAKTQAARTSLVAAAKTAMWSDILAAMEPLYATTSETSALTLQAIWTDMEAHPELNINASLPTAEAVTAYIGPKMILARAFSAYNLARRAQYEAEVAAILA